MTAPLRPFGFAQGRPRRLRAIFFDLDDTLCDTEGLTPLRLAAVREAFAGEVPVNRLDSALQQAAAWDPVGPGRRLQRLGEVLELSEGQRQRLREVYNRALIERLRLYPGVKELLAWLRQRMVVGLITNGPSELQRAKLGALGIGPYFHTVLISGEVGVNKPDPRIFLLALASISAEPQEALYVGDRPDMDIAGAKAAGMPTVQVRTAFAFPLPPGPAADHVLAEIRALPELLRSQGWLGDGRRPSRRVGGVASAPREEAPRG